MQRGFPTSCYIVSCYKGETINREDREYDTVTVSYQQMPTKASVRSMRLPLMQFLLASSLPVMSAFIWWNSQNALQMDVLRHNTVAHGA